MFGTNTALRKTLQANTKKKDAMNKLLLQNKDEKERKQLEQERRNMIKAYEDAKKELEELDCTCTEPVEGPVQYPESRRRNSL